MKISRLTAMILVAAVSCTIPGGEVATKGEIPIPEGQGLLILKWKGDSRSLLGSDWASSVADAYELILQGASGNRAVPLDSGSGQVIAVDPGTYRSTVLAGIKRSSGSNTAYLVGSATADSVVVSLGQRTELNLVMKSIDISVSCPTPAYWGGSVTLNTSGKTRNPSVGMQLSGSSTTNRPRFKSAELWSGYREMTSVTGTPDDWSATATGNVPTSGASFQVGLVGAGLCLLTLDNQWVPTVGITAFSWYWCNRAELSETHPLIPYSEVVVSCGPPPTGLEVTLAWE